jgi:hypothetical protein
MKVRCVANRGSDLPSDLITPATSIHLETDFSLIVDKTYVVYALTIRDNYMWYYVCDEDFSYFPFWKPSPLFEIVDHRLSAYWEINYSREGRCESKSNVIVAYSEWARDPFYYDRLTDGYEKEVEIFQRYRRLIDDESGG